MMSFIWPWLLLTLLIIPVLMGLYFRLLQRQNRLRANFAHSELIQGFKRPPPQLRRHIPFMFFMLGLSISLMALARPRAYVSLPRVEGLVILAFDVSGSMAADDLKPTRMEAAKNAALKFIEQQPLSVQIGVVAFSDNGFSIQAPTNDRELIEDSIMRLVPERGTSLAKGIIASLNTIAAMQAVEAPRYYSNLTPEPTPSPTPVPPETYTSAAIVLLTDGENNQDPDPLLAAEEASKRGVRIYTVGIGSPAGANLKIEGFTVNTRLDEPLLQAIANLTGGTYYSADNETELLNIYDQLNLQLAIHPEETEVTSLFAGASIIVLLIGGALSLFWFSRLP
jgi:Ca-activated chloride channel family protein